MILLISSSRQIIWSMVDLCKSQLDLLMIIGFFVINYVILMVGFLHFVEGFIALIECCFDYIIPEWDDFSVLGGFCFCDGFVCYFVDSLYENLEVLFYIFVPINLSKVKWENALVVKLLQSAFGNFQLRMKVFSVLGFSLYVMINVKLSHLKFELNTYQLNLVGIFGVVEVRSNAIDVVAFGWIWVGAPVFRMA